MAITYKSQGAGASTEVSGASLILTCPAVVDAGDILIAHVYVEANAIGPGQPAGWAQLSLQNVFPQVIENPTARHWFIGKIADGTEDGANIDFGANVGLTIMRGGRIYSFAGRVSGTIHQLITYRTHVSHASTPQMPTVTTLQAGSLAVALIGQNDNNTAGNATGMSGGTWTERVAEYSPALTPGMMLQIQAAVPTANPGTISGGTTTTASDPVGVIGFAINAAPLTVTVVGNQPTATGTLGKSTFKGLAGSQPNATGTLTKKTLKALAGNQPAASGTIAAAKLTFKALAGNQPAASGTIAAARFSSVALAGNQPAASGTLTAFKSASVTLVGNQPAPSGTLAALQLLQRTLEGNQPAASGVVTALLIATPVVTVAPVEPLVGGGMVVRPQRTNHVATPVELRYALRLAVEGERVRAPARRPVKVETSSNVELILGLQIQVSGELEYLEDELVAEALLMELTASL